MNAEDKIEQTGEMDSNTYVRWLQTKIPLYQQAELPAYFQACEQHCEPEWWLDMDCDEMIHDFQKWWRHVASRRK